MSLQWRHNGRDSVSNHQPHDCLLNRLFRHRSKKPSKLRVTGLCEGNSLVAGEFPAQRTSNVENISIWWRYHVQLHFLGLKLPYSICKKKSFFLWVWLQISQRWSTQWLGAEEASSHHLTLWYPDLRRLVAVLKIRTIWHATNLWKLVPFKQ